MYTFIFITKLYSTHSCNSCFDYHLVSGFNVYSYWHILWKKHTNLGKVDYIFFYILFRINIIQIHDDFFLFLTYFQKAFLRNCMFVVLIPIREWFTHVDTSFCQLRHTSITSYVIAIAFDKDDPWCTLYHTLHTS